MKVAFTHRALKDLNNLDRITQKQILKKLEFYRSTNDPLSYSKKLVDRPDGMYRWRVGHFRIVFDVEKQTITLLRIQQRREIYRK